MWEVHFNRQNLKRDLTWVHFFLIPMSDTGKIRQLLRNQMTPSMP
jgi:hypothetical protein